MATYPQRVTLATVLACVVWGGVAIPECSVDILGVDKVINNLDILLSSLALFQKEGLVVIGVTDHREELCHKVKARAVLRQEEEEDVEEGLVLEIPLLMAEGEGLVMQKEGISFFGGSKGVLCQGAGEAEEVWEALKCLVGKHAVPRRAEVSDVRMRMYFLTISR